MSRSPQDKTKWIEDHLQCPDCRSSRFTFSETSARCEACGRSFGASKGKFDFLNAESIRQFGIVATESVSSNHPVYSGPLLEWIERIEAGGGMVLDCGSGYVTRPYPAVVQMEVVNYPNVDIIAVNQRIPFKADSFDAVFSFDVLEHVDNPFLCARELARVLKPGGVLWVDVPFLQPEHGYPHHYFNMSRMGLLKLFSGLLLAEKHYVPESGHPMQSLIWFLNSYAENLPGEQRREFENLTIRQLRSRTADDWSNQAVGKFLSEEGRWVLASTTQAIMRKPATASQVSQRPETVEDGPANVNPLSPEIMKSMEIEALRRELATLHRSVSWRVTKPLRFVSGRILPPSWKIAIRRALFRD